MKKIIRYHCNSPDCPVEGGAYFEGGIMRKCPVCRSGDIEVAGDHRRYAS